MTAKEVFTSQTFQLLIYAAVIGVAWGTLKSEVGQKADRQEVASTATALAATLAKTNAAQATIIQTMAADIKTIKAILCQQASKDSFCHARLD
jgi:uncharacterized membrane protein affecting hemolysin expression